VYTKLLSAFALPAIENGLPNDWRKIVRIQRTLTPEKLARIYVRNCIVSYGFRAGIKPLRVNHGQALDKGTWSYNKGSYDPLSEWVRIRRRKGYKPF
jgi:hypothetical protein